MKKTFLVSTTWGFALFVLCLLTVTGCSSKNRSSTTERDPTGPTSYAVPEEKTQLWESLKNVAQKDYDVCLEHCGYSQSCMDRCETAYNYRLENEYNRLTK